MTRTRGGGTRPPAAFSLINTVFGQLFWTKSTGMSAEMKGRTLGHGLDTYLLQHLFGIGENSGGQTLNASSVKAAAASTWR
jgi:hypothetical protein